MHASVFFDVLEFRGLNQASTFGKCEAFDRADDVDLTGRKTGTNQVGAIDLNRPRGGSVNRPTIISVQQKPFAHRSERKTSQIIGFRRLRRRRRVDVDIGFSFRLGSGRRIHNCSVALLFLRRRIRYRCFLLLTSRQKRGTH
jgi:hypothetical protein